MLHVCGKSRLGALIILALLVSGCQKDRQSGLPTPSGEYAARIADSEYPAVVMVVAPGGAGICTGTFVSEKAVLTAAHCVLDSGTYTIQSSFGTFQSSNVRKLGQGLVDDPHDIALIILPSAVASRSKKQVYDFNDNVHEGDTLRLIGYGCSSVETRRGAGVKRTGTNAVADLNDYIEFLTPVESSNAARGIIGRSNRAGSCFGDSGGPAVYERNGAQFVTGVTHAGGQSGSNQVSQYVNVATDSDNRGFLRSVSADLNLDIRGI